MSLQDRIRKWGKNLNDVCLSRQNLPCYSLRLHTPKWCDTAEKILDVVEGSMEDTQHGILVISITERDLHHKLWLNTLKETYEELTIVKTKTRHFQEYYTCWMCLIPLYD